MALFEGFTHHSQSIDGIDIAYTIGGSGPPVLLLHGYPQTRAMWAKVAPVLAENFTVVCADLRGYGQSSKPKRSPDNSNYSFRSMAADQIGLMHRLGFEKFHVIGHDRGGRTAHRMALDHPEAILTVGVLDIIPTYTMFMQTDHVLSGTYYHWYMLSQDEPLPERLIGQDPDFFYESCLTKWGSATIPDYDSEQLAAYREAWHSPDMIHATCSDYRATATIDLEHDGEDLDRKITCPTLVLYGADGAMAKLFDMEEEWRKFSGDVQSAAIEGGHFFIDLNPDSTAKILNEFLCKHTGAA